jgi:hypothetical protein
MHDLGEIWLGSLYQKMVMVIHQHIRIQKEVILDFGGKKILKKFLKVIITDEDFFAVISTAGNMIKTILTLYSIWSGHGHMLLLCFFVNLFHISSPDVTPFADLL